MRYTSFFLAILLCVTTEIVTAQIMFQRGYYPSDNNYYATFPATSLAEASNGDFLLVTEIGVVIRTNHLGEPLWQKLANRPLSSAMVNLGGVFQDFENNTILVGTTSSSGASEDTLLISKLDAEGNILSVKGFSHGDLQHLRTVRTDDEGAIIIAKFTTESPIENYPLITRINSEGNIIWQKTYTNIPEFSEYYNQYTHGNCEISDVSQCSNGDLLMCGRTGLYPAGNAGNFILRTSSSGNILWVKGLSTTTTIDLEKPIRIAELDNGNIRVVIANPIIGTQTKIALLNLDSDGTVTWSKAYSASDSNGAPPTDAIISGSGETVISILRDLVKFSNEGNVEFAKTYLTQNSFASLRTLIKTSDNGYAAVGKYGDGLQSQNALLVKTDNSGQSLPLTNNIEITEVAYTNNASPATLMDSVITAPFFELDLSMETFQGADTLFGFSTGLDLTLQNNEINVFPNPACDLLFIQCDKLTTDKIEFFLLQAYGALKNCCC